MQTTIQRESAVPSGECATNGRAAESTALFVDAHAHYFECFGLERFLESAWANLQAASDAAGIDGDSFGCLMLCEGDEDRSAFERIQHGVPHLSSRWSVERGEEQESWIVERAGRAVLTLIAGRQTVSREGIEVLALGTHARLSHGLSLEDTLQNAVRCGAIAVVPWGFGKWWFGRGRMLKDLLSRMAAVNENGDGEGDVFLGDNGNRTLGLGNSGPFRLAERFGLRILPGSDPLPFPGHAARAGSYGLVLETTGDVRRPLEQIQRALSGGAAQPPAFGRLESLGGFCRSQVAMQLRKRGLARA